jgi:DNA-binding XRE family transcriptional regulator
MRTHDEMIAAWMKDPAFKAEYDRLERREMPMLDAILSIRKEAKLSQDEAARRMNVSPPVVSRLERALLTGRPSPSIRTLQKYAKAVGKRLKVSLV